MKKIASSTPNSIDPGKKKVSASAIKGRITVIDYDRDSLSGVGLRNVEKVRKSTVGVSGRVSHVNMRSPTNDDNPFLSAPMGNRVPSYNKQNTGGKANRRVSMMVGTKKDNL